MITKDGISNSYSFYQILPLKILKVNIFFSTLIHESCELIVHHNHPQHNSKSMIPPSKKSSKFNEKSI